MQAMTSGTWLVWRDTHNIVADAHESYLVGPGLLLASSQQMGCALCVRCSVTARRAGYSAGKMLAKLAEEEAQRKAETKRAAEAKRAEAALRAVRCD